MISTKSRNHRKRLMIDEEKQPQSFNLNGTKLDNVIEEVDPDVVLVAKGHASGGVADNVEIAIYLYDKDDPGFANKLPEGLYPASIATVIKGKVIAKQNGLMKHVMDENKPTFFTYYPRDIDGGGPYDVVKMYKRDDSFECSFYTESLSIMWKRSNQRDEYTLEDRKRINKLRKETGWKAKLDIVNDLTLIQVPDTIDEKIPSYKNESNDDSNTPSPGMG